jgi:hypothetical protein
MRPQEIRHGSRVFLLLRPLTVRRHRERGLWIHEVRPLSILAYGPSIETSWESLCMDVATLWDVIANERDEELTGDARNLKAKLLCYVRQPVEVNGKATAKP